MLTGRDYRLIFQEKATSIKVAINAKGTAYNTKSTAYNAPCKMGEFDIRQCWRSILWIDMSNFIVHTRK